MNCDEISSIVGLYLDEEIPKEQSDDLKLHLSICPDCGALVASENKFRKILKEGITKKSVSPEFIQEVKEAIRYQV